jgi:hypothetical protein
MNHYDESLIQDTTDFFYYAGSTISQVLAHYAGIDSERVTSAGFFDWLFAHQIERVFGFTCEGHGRREHPYVRLVDRMRNLIDLDGLTKAHLLVPQVYADQVVKVFTWGEDLVIQYNRPHPLNFGNMIWKPELARLLPLHHSSNN